MEIKPGANAQSRKIASFWKDQIEDFCGTKDYKRYIERGSAVIKRYRDERSRDEARRDRRLNILWANVKVLKPALYSKLPIPVVERKFLQHDPKGRLSATILERAVKAQIQENGLNSSISKAVLDYLLPGRGQVWVRYEPEIEQGDSIAPSALDNLEDGLDEIQEDFGSEEDTPEEEKLEGTGEQLLSEQAPVDYIDWKDWLFFPAKARHWDEVQAVAKRVHLSKTEAIERFGDEIGGQIKPDTDPVGSSTSGNHYNTSFEDVNRQTVTIYEIWNKTDRRVYWVSMGYEYICDVKEDPLKLKRFFPCPAPIDASITNDVFLPISDYWEYQDQAIQIDELTQRLALLTQACKIAGTYDASSAGLKRLLDEGTENVLIPVDNWAMFAEKGGVKGGISLLPIDEIQKVIQTLQQVRQQLMQDLDLVTGITDIQRGTTDSRETLGGIRLKNNNTGTRLSERQNEVARFVRDVIAIVAEIIAKHFDDKTIIMSSGILYDDELQPEAIVDELESKQPSEPQQPQLPAPQPGPGPMPVMGPGMTATPPNVPIMGQQPPQPQPQLQLQPPPQSNVLPFPGGPQPPNPMMGGMMGLQPMQPPKPDINMIVAKKLQDALAILRKDVPRNYRIDIETDSTIFGDAAQERQDAVEFIQGVTGFLQAAAALGQELPESVPLFGAMLQFGVRKFRTGRDLENRIDTFVRQMDKKAKEASKNPQPDPEIAKAQMEMKMQQETHAANMQKLQAENAIKAQNDQRDAQVQAMEDKRKMEMSAAEDNRQSMLAQNDMAIKLKTAHMDMAVKEREHSMTLEQMELENKYNKEAHETKMKELRLQSAEKEKSRKDKSKQKKAS